ncbi:MAG: ABC transporter permease [Gemmatimonadetes bacterium]|nr:ABC transporter permease [Gemmatimonadota bacterium]
MSSPLSVALRSLRRSPLTAAAAILTIALGVGATTTIYGVVDATMLQPLPWAEAARLMEPVITVQEAGEATLREMTWSYPKFETLREQQRSFSDLAGYTSFDVLLDGGDGNERVEAEMVTGNYFRLLQLPMALGRGLQPTDDAAGAPPVTVLSHATWMRRFGGDAGVVGRTLSVGAVRAEVVGVAAEPARALSGRAALWVPMSVGVILSYPELLQERWNHWFDAVGRLRPGVTPEAAVRELQLLGPRIDAAHPFPEAGGGRYGATGHTLREARHDPALARAVLILLGAVCCVLLIACVNVANLLLARASARDREFAVRMAIGARRGQLVRQMLAETMLLSLVGGVLGVVIAAWSVDALHGLEAMTSGARGTQAAQFLDFGDIRLHPGVLAFGLALSLGTGLMCGILPAWRASRPVLTESLKDGAGSTTEGSLSLRRGRSRALLIVGNVALSLLLLVGAGLFTRSFAKARGIDGGFTPAHVLTFRVQAPDDSAYAGASRAMMKEAILTRLTALPGVEAAAIGNCAPLAQACDGTIVLSVDGVALPESGERPEIGVHLASAGYLKAIGARLIAGRFIEDTDDASAPTVGVISETTAKRLFPNQNPLGKRMGIGFSRWKDAEIVGVVSDVNYGAVGAPPALAFYGSYKLAPRPSALVLVRADAAPSTFFVAARQIVRSVGPALAVYDERTLEERVGSALARLRFGAVLLGAFAGLGLLLAVIGIYGVLAYSVEQRTRELGIRLALGALQREVVAAVMRRAMLLAGIGVAVGLAAAWGASRFVRGLVFGISPTDPVTFVGQTLALVLVCAVASYIPARRAARLDPVRALRNE